MQSFTKMVAGVLLLATVTGCGSRSAESPQVAARPPVDAAPHTTETATVRIVASVADTPAERAVEHRTQQAVGALLTAMVRREAAGLNQSFINAESPVPEEGLYNATAMVQANNWIEGGTSTQITFESVVLKENRASVRFREETQIQNSHGSAYAITRAWELVQHDGAWFVSGFSTFPHAGERRAVFAAAERWQAERGQAFTIGEIQFWQMSEPHLAPEVQWANYARVHLRAGGQGYFLTLARKGGEWQAGGLRSDSERPASLF